MARYYQGFFKPSNPDKYKGDPTNIVYRSSWELKMMDWLDTHPSVLNWASEEVSIVYNDPTTNRLRRYFPDFVVKLKDDKGKKKILIIEIKPLAQTQPSKATNKRRYMKENFEYAKNVAKWQAAKTFCEERNWEFQVLTEKSLGIK